MFERVAAVPSDYDFTSALTIDSGLAQRIRGAYRDSHNGTVSTSYWVFDERRQS